MDPLLAVDNLKLYFRTTRGVVQAVDGVTFTVTPGTAVVVVGESGCGKSSLAKAILRLLPRNVEVYSGQILLEGQNIMELDDEQFRRMIRWKKISYVAQGSMNSLNPVIKVGAQLAEPILLHEKVAKTDVWKRVVEAFSIVGVPTDFINRYPFELSGGMKQRVVIAMALVTKPKLVIMDEPTSALDVLTQANIMNALKRIREDLNLTYILITHDVSTSSELALDAMVMYAGQIVELGKAGHFFLEPLHPYSQKLMSSVPTLREDKELDYIPGQPPSLINPPPGCRFAPRCHKRFSACDREPPMVDYKDDRKIKCHLYA